MRIALTLALSLVLGALPSTALAAQDLLLDTGVYDHVADNSPRNGVLGKGGASLKGSHAFFKTTPVGASSWVTPIPYRDGRMEIVVDVLEKPSDAVVRLAICMDDGGVTCAGTAEFTAKGRYRFGQKVGTGYSVNPDYDRGFRFAAVILRDGAPGDGKKLDLGQGFLGEPDYSRYFPLKMRVRAWLLSPDATFALPSDELPDAGMDSGSLDGGPTTSPEPDASSATSDDDDDLPAADADGSPTSSGGLDRRRRSPDPSSTAGCAVRLPSEDPSVDGVALGGVCAALVLLRRQRARRNAATRHRSRALGSRTA